MNMITGSSTDHGKSISCFWRTRYSRVRFLFTYLTLGRDTRRIQKGRLPMKLVRRFVLAFALLMAAAPVVGFADSPLPGCYPCQPTGK